MKTIYNYLRYSGLIVSFQFNPLLWRFTIVPFPGYKLPSGLGSESTFVFSILFLTVTFWFDKGDW
jgi:hypothetical protein